MKSPEWQVQLGWDVTSRVVPCPVCGTELQSPVILKYFRKHKLTCPCGLYEIEARYMADVKLTIGCKIWHIKRVNEPYRLYRIRIREVADTIEETRRMYHDDVVRHFKIEENGVVDPTAVSVFADLLEERGYPINAKACRVHASDHQYDHFHLNRKKDAK